MHHQPDGARRASALLDRLKNEPELQLGQTNEARLARAAAELRACSSSLGPAGPAGAGPSAAAAPAHAAVLRHVR